MPSQRFVDATTKQETPEVPVFLVTITHASFAEPIRWTDGGADIESRGDLFAARAMKISAPGEGSEASTRRGRVLIDNIEQDAIAALRSVPSGRPRVLLELVLASFPDDVEFSWPGLQLIATRPTGDLIEADLSPRDDSEEEYPVQTFSQKRTPGLYS